MRAVIAKEVRVCAASVVLPQLALEDFCERAGGWPSAVVLGRRSAVFSRRLDAVLSRVLWGRGEKFADIFPSTLQWLGHGAILPGVGAPQFLRRWSLARKYPPTASWRLQGSRRSDQEKFGKFLEWDQFENGERKRSVSWVVYRDSEFVENALGIAPKSGPPCLARDRVHPIHPTHQSKHRRYRALILVRSKQHARRIGVRSRSKYLAICSTSWPLPYLKLSDMGYQTRANAVCESMAAKARLRSTSYLLFGF